ncbi:hypothetical protein [Bacillus sp. FJAT-47783]|uniref:hypothetical protein n=1 Tax=Bacillus sp. FJAT-47783 TaxID=2922712 RepID=UPI001FAC2982|nr:hypothetical protein [Bacillus sp. FJAT-47783]
MKIFALISCGLLVLLAGCTNDKPTPEGVTHDTVPTIEVLNMQELSHSTDQSMSVRHHVRGNRVYVECYVSHFTFSEGNGYLQLSIDGNKIKRLRTAAFVIKDLSKGKHQIKVELVKNDHSKQVLKKEWTVDIHDM